MIKLFSTSVIFLQIATFLEKKAMNYFPEFFIVFKISGFFFYWIACIMPPTFLKERMKFTKSWVRAWGRGGDFFKNQRGNQKREGVENTNILWGNEIFSGSFSVS